MSEKLQQLRTREQAALEAGGAQRVERQHKAGKLTARQRLELLFDGAHFLETDLFGLNRRTALAQEEQIYGDGVITAIGEINGRKTYAYAQDFTVYGGSLAPAHARKICKLMDLAEQNGCPVVGLSDSGGARIQEGVESLAGYADIFYRNVRCSGVIPQLSLIMGPCAGGAVYSPAITDFILMVESTSHMFITGPDVIKTVTHEEVDKEYLGGAETHTNISGVAHLHSADDTACIAQCRELLTYLPQNNSSGSTFVDLGDTTSRTSPELNEIVPEDPNKPYDVRTIISELADAARFLELQPGYAQNIVTGFIRLNGNSIGVVANQPAVLAGCLDIQASTKAARFVRFCDSFQIPILTLVDVPGFLPGVTQEHGGIIRHGAKLLYAFAEATVPKVTVILRKAYGGAYDVMSSKHIGADFNFAWPTAEVAVMGPEGAVEIINRKDLEGLKDPAKIKEVKSELVQAYREKFANPWSVAELGYVDAVIEPSTTRSKLIECFKLLETKRPTLPNRKHGNIPL